MRSGSQTTRDRIIAAAAALLHEAGREAVSTRAVSVAAGVQAPTIYRLFGDKLGLLDAVAEYGVQRYLASKTHDPALPDPIDDLRRGWDSHLSFGLENPALYTLIYGEPRHGPLSPAAQTAMEMLAEKMQRVAASGRLRVSTELAVRLMHALACGTTLSLIASPPELDRQALSNLAWQAAISAITTNPPVVTEAGPANMAIALREALPQTTRLSEAELALMREWLDRLATPGDSWMALAPVTQDGGDFTEHCKR
jgi:AcrR family transcriptional regulator